MRILITGSREWWDHRAITTILDRMYCFNPLVIVHGGARGADSIARDWVEDWESFHQDLTQEIHLADWDTYGKSAGHRRNGEMVASGIDLCLAFPMGESRGTRGCIEMVRKHRPFIPMNIYEGVARA